MLFLMKDYDNGPTRLCSYDAGADGSNQGGGASDGFGAGGGTDTADNGSGYVDNGDFDVAVNSTTLGTQTAATFSAVAHAVGQSMQVGGFAAGVPGAAVIGGVISAAPDIATATQQGFQGLVENADIMGGPMATESTTSTSTNSNSGNVGFGGGGDPNIGFWVPPATWGNNLSDWQGRLTC